LDDEESSLFISSMDSLQLLAYLEGIDRALRDQATLYIYGSAACILLGEPDRTSLDVDVAGPYSDVDQGDLRRAAETVGLPVNPADDYAGDHIEWVGPLRLCLRPPVESRALTLWQGSKLRIRTGPIADLIASKLIRYDEIDQSDIRYLLTQGDVAFADVEAAVAQLPAPFANDPLVRKNLLNLKADMDIWRGGRT
jgi:hypothetical protein